MLVLSRKVNETVVIDDNTRITVLDIRGESVRLGFNAPPEVPIYRDEVHRRVLAERSGRPGPAQASRIPDSVKDALVTLACWIDRNNADTAQAVALGQMRGHLAALAEACECGSQCSPDVTCRES